MPQPPIMRPYEAVRVFEKFGWGSCASEGEPHNNDKGRPHRYAVDTKAFHRGSWDVAKSDWQGRADTRRLSRCLREVVISGKLLGRFR